MFSLSRFGQLLKNLPRAGFDNIIERLGADRWVKHFGCQELLVALVYGQLSEAASLRQLEHGLNQHSRHLYHLGLGKIRRSTVADACARRNPQAFEELAQLMISLAGASVRKQRQEMLYLLDSTCIPLVGRGLQWAGEFATRIPGLRMHMLYANNQQVPVYFTITGENVPDVVEGKKIPIQRGATYVFDKGYCDYDWWGSIDAAGATFVTRVKRNAALHVVGERSLDHEVQSVKSDREVQFKYTSNRGGHKNAFASAKLRRIEVALEGKAPLILVTNDLHSSAAMIAALYKERWQIELFFKWIKQNLKIKKFLGQSENAIRIQLMAALVCYLLIVLLRATTTQTLREIMDQLRTGLFNRPQTEESSYRRRRLKDQALAAVQPRLFR